MTGPTKHRFSVTDTRGIDWTCECLTYPDSNDFTLMSAYLGDDNLTLILTDAFLEWLQERCIDQFVTLRSAV